MNHESITLEYFSTEVYIVALTFSIESLCFLLSHIDLRPSICLVHAFGAVKRIYSRPLSGLWHQYLQTLAHFASDFLLSHGPPVFRLSVLLFQPSFPFSRPDATWRTRLS